MVMYRKTMQKSLIVHMIKDKNKRVSDRDNYRLICLSNVFTKIVEKITVQSDAKSSINYM